MVRRSIVRAAVRCTVVLPTCVVLGLAMGRGQAASCPPWAIFSPVISPVIPISEPWAIVPFDIDGDGASELAISRENGVTVLRANPDGSRTVLDAVTIAGIGKELIAVDLDGDGREDLLRMNEDEQRVEVIRNTVDGLALGATYPVGLMPGPADSGDLDGDGHLDVVVESGWFGDSSLTVFRGMGDGTLEPITVIPLATTVNAVRIVDLDADGACDIVFTDRPNDRIVVLPGLGDGTFGPSGTHAVPGGPLKMTIADLDGDGMLDIAVNGLDRRLRVLFGSGGGELQPPVALEGLEGLGDIAAADLDGDGALDLVICRISAQDVSVRLGRGDRTFEPPVRFGAGFSSSRLAVIRLPGDEIPDLVVASPTVDEIWLLAGRGDGTFVAQPRYGLGVGPQEIAAADLDGDGWLDVIAATEVGLSTTRGEPGGTFGPEHLLDGGMGGATVAVGDLDGDGRLDVVARRLVGGGLGFAVLHQRPDGSFDPRVEYPGLRLSDLVLADVNKDGVLDVLGAAHSALVVRLGAGDGTFGPEQVLPSKELGGGLESIVAADLDGDGHLDVAGANWSYDLVETWPGLKDGTFGSSSIRPLEGSGPSDVEAADLTGDGIVDLVTANRFSNDVSLLPGTGDGTFGPELRLAVGPGPTALDVADLNDDGRLDIATSSRSNDSWLLIAGDAGFAAAPVRLGPYVSDLLLVDVDEGGDGRPDVLAIPGSLVVVLNECPAACFADVDGDAIIGLDDLLAVLASWGPCAGCPADVDEDGTVGFSDLLGVLATWGPCGG